MFHRRLPQAGRAIFVFQPSRREIQAELEECPIYGRFCLVGGSSWTRVRGLAVGSRCRIRFCC